MPYEHPSPQRIARLTPLKDVLSFLDQAAKPVAARTVAIEAACGCVLAQDCTAPAALPPHPIALRDGFAVRADATSDASSYAPALLPVTPLPVDVGARMPDKCDAVALPDTVTAGSGPFQIATPLAPGEGLLPAGADASASQTLLGAGMRLTASRIAASRAAGFSSVAVRQPRIRVVAAGKDTIIETAGSMLCSLIAAQGAIMSEGDNLEAAFADAEADAVIGIGGTGMGSRDRSVVTLAQAGNVGVHGIALSPGETAAAGTAGSRPVLLFPGRIDAVLACWLMLGLPLVARLSGAVHDRVARSAALSRKITSAIGMTDVVLVRHEGTGAEPLASGYWPLHAIAKANGFVVVPADSEGYPAGTTVAVNDLP